MPSTKSSQVTTDRLLIKTVFAFNLLGTLVTFILVSLQFFVAAGIPKNTELHVPVLLQLLCCFFSCQCRKLDGDIWRKVLQTFAVRFLMVFLQLVASWLCDPLFCPGYSQSRTLCHVFGSWCFHFVLPDCICCQSHSHWCSTQKIFLLQQVSCRSSRSVICCIPRIS